MLVMDVAYQPSVHRRPTRVAFFGDPVFDAGDELPFAAALFAAFNVDRKHAL